MDPVGKYPLKDQPVPEGYYEEWLKLLEEAHDKDVRERDETIVVFRLHGEAFAWPTTSFFKVCETKSLHKLPNNKIDEFLGVVNMDGQLKVCVSMHKLLDVPECSHPMNNQPRMVAIEEGKDIFVFPVEELFGIYPLCKEDIKEAPVTVTKSRCNFLKGIIPWSDTISVGLIDHKLLFDHLRSIQSDNR